MLSDAGEWWAMLVDGKDAGKGTCVRNIMSGSSVLSGYCVLCGVMNGYEDYNYRADENK